MAGKMGLLLSAEVLSVFQGVEREDIGLLEAAGLEIGVERAPADLEEVGGTAVAVRGEELDKMERGKSNTLEVVGDL